MKIFQWQFNITTFKLVTLTRAACGAKMCPLPDSPAAIWVVSLNLPLWV